MTNVLIYGLGNFGYAFLRHLDNKGDKALRLMAYDYKRERIDYMAEHYRHPSLEPAIKMSHEVCFVHNLEDALLQCDVVLLAVPSSATRETLRKIALVAKKPITIVNTAKALDLETGDRLSEVAKAELKNTDHTYALLAGGTIATDLFNGEHLGMDLACEDETRLDYLVNIFQTNNLHIYPTTDLTGVEYASALKNVISIIAGIVNGLGLSHGTETYVISRIAHMIGEACVSTFHARPETFSIGSQCWGNDMWMSCTGSTRNREFGNMISSSGSASAALDKMRSRGKLLEGINTLSIIGRVGQLDQVDVVRSLYRLVIEQDMELDEFRSDLLRL